MHGFNTITAKKSKILTQAREFNGMGGDLLIFENDDGSAKLFY